MKSIVKKSVFLKIKFHETLDYLKDSLDVSTVAMLKSRAQPLRHVHVFCQTIKRSSPGPDTNSKAATSIVFQIFFKMRKEFSSFWTLLKQSCPNIIRLLILFVYSLQFKYRLIDSCWTDASM